MIRAPKTARLLLLTLLATALALPGAALAEGALPAPSGITLDSLGAQVRIVNHFARTEVQTTFTNHDAVPLEVTLAIAASDLAFISRFALEVNGSVHESTIEREANASALYDEARSEGRSAGLIAQSGANRLSLSLSVPASTTLTAHLAYEELIAKVQGEFRYRLPLVAAAGGYELGALHIAGAVEGRSAITYFDVSNGSPSFTGSTSFSFAWDAASLSPASDFTVMWREDAPVGAGEVIAHSTPEGVYFLHRFSPDGAGLAAQPLPKDIVFVIDHSGSMGTEKMKQARDALNGILGELRTDDHFTVIAFDSTTVTFAATLQPASQSRVQDARGWVSNINANGGTNIDAGLAEAIKVLSSAQSEAPILVFLTDGRPSAGETNPAAIRANLIANNMVGAAVFTLAFGADADDTLLRQIAAENHGEFRAIPVSANAATEIQGFYNTFGTPALSGVTFTYSTVDGTVKVPASTAAYAGSDLVFAGLLDPGTTDLRVEVAGASANGPYTAASDVDLTAAESGDFAERAYAYARIRELERHAVLDDAAAKEEITRLALKYGFVTEYTSLVVVVPAELRPPMRAELDQLTPSRLSAGGGCGNCAPGAPMAASGIAGIGAVGALIAVALVAIGLATRRRRLR